MNIKWTLVVFCFLLFVTGCSQPHEPVQELGAEIDPYNCEISIVPAAHLPVPDDLAGMEANSIAIVRGYLLDDAKEHTQTLAGVSSGDAVVYGATSHTLHVTEAFQGDLAKGDEVLFCESYLYTKGGSGEPLLIMFTDRMPTQVGREYLFFLGQNAADSDFLPGAYYIKYLEMGRYPYVKNQSEAKIEAYSAQDMRLNPQHNEVHIDSYKDIYKEIAQKYMA